MGKRPPDILRKSHAHTTGKERANAKAALKHAVEGELDDGDDEASSVTTQPLAASKSSRRARARRGPGSRSGASGDSS